MSEHLHSILKLSGFFLFMTFACLGWLFIVVRRRHWWLRWTAAEAAFYKQIGLSEATIEASRRFEEGRNLIFVVCAMIIASLILTVASAWMYFHFHRFESSEKLFNLGMAEYERKESKAALREFSKVIELNPTNASAYSLRGATKNQLGDYRGAIADCTTAIQLDPKYSVGAYDHRALARINTGDYSGAISDCQKSLSLNPKDAAAYNQRGMAESYLTNYSAALADFNMSILLHPNSPQPYNNRGYLRAAQKDYRGAIADYSKAIELDPKYEMAYNNRGNLKNSLKDYSGAIADFDKAIALVPYYTAAISNRNVAAKMLPAPKKK